MSTFKTSPSTDRIKKLIASYSAKRHAKESLAGSKKAESINSTHAVETKKRPPLNSLLKKYEENRKKVILEKAEESTQFFEIVQITEEDDLSLIRQDTDEYIIEDWEGITEEIIDSRTEMFTLVEDEVFQEIVEEKPSPKSDRLSLRERIKSYESKRIDSTNTIQKLLNQKEEDQVGSGEVFFADSGTNQIECLDVSNLSYPFEVAIDQSNRLSLMDKIKSYESKRNNSSNTIQKLQNENEEDQVVIYVNSTSPPKPELQLQSPKSSDGQLKVRILNESFALTKKERLKMQIASYEKKRSGLSIPVELPVTPPPPADPKEESKRRIQEYMRKLKENRTKHKELECNNIVEVNSEVYKIETKHVPINKKDVQPLLVTMLRNS